MSIALIHDFLLQKGGAEKVLQAIYELYDGDVFTLMHNHQFNYPNIHSSYLNHPFLHRFYRPLFPFYPKAIESFDLNKYELILSSSYAFAKNVQVFPHQLHICYCHTPMRILYDLYFEQLGRFKGCKKLAFEHFSHNLRNWDLVSCNRVDAFIANSHFVAGRIEKFYRRKPEAIIYPPVDIEKFHGVEKKEDYYIYVGRLVPYKGIELLVETFEKQKDKTLLIVGKGPLLKVFQKRRLQQVQFLGYLPDEKMIYLLKRALGFVFMGIEDFGIALVEALASGTPLIALNQGGAKEIMKDSFQGVFVKAQTRQSLEEALLEFEKKSFDYQKIQESVVHFSKERFKKEFKSFVDNRFFDFLSHRSSN